MIRLCASILSANLAAAQPGTPPSPEQPRTPDQPAKVRYEDLPPAVQLGLRAEAIQHAWPTLPVVVIVPNTGSYIEAIGAWTPRTRFPVLIDDGTPASREDIARFVRGFKPERTVRWAGATKVLEPAAIRPAADAALVGVWAKAAPGEEADAKIASHAEMIARWKAIGVPRTGIVVASVDDPTWPAALALAAGRAQPLAWVKRPPKQIDAAFTIAEFRAFEADLESACRDSGLAWEKLGDEIDAVAVCMGIPGRVQAGGTHLAMTDCLARRHGESIDTGDRWAWAAQISGTESRAAYAAMCALFLGTSKAWLFDGYPQSKPWSDFDATGAAAYLSRVGVDTVVDDAPRSGERAWRVRAGGAVDAGLIAVNTKGMAGEFHLEPGRCIPADVPVLNTPAIVYFVHSWSALSPIDRTTVGARWLERGAYAYLGSVDEPYLQAFIPTPIAMGRLASRYPWAAAVRADDLPGRAKAWKLTVLGDPLTMISRGVPRVEEPLPLPGVVDLQDAMREALAARDFEGAIRSLTLQGRDADVAALVRAVLNDDTRALTPAAAEDALFPLFREGDVKTFVRAYELLPGPAARRGDLRDALWHMAYRVLPETREQALLSLLRVNIRDDVRARDAQELADPFAAVYGPDAAARMLEDVRQKLGDPGESQKIDSLIRRHQSNKIR